MTFRRMALWLAAAVLALWPFLSCPVTPARAAETGGGRERALLVGIDEFVSRPSAYPSSTNNVYAMQALFQAAARPLETLILPDGPVTSPEELARLIHETFSDARKEDTSYLYLCTHGEYNAQTGEARLLLSDGVVENGITPAQLEAAFAGIEGMKVLILDACNSGAFIGKGMSRQPDALSFLGDDFKVLTSSGALEESWYWSSSEWAEQGPQGAFYFTQALTQGLSAATGYPADQNRDGQVTLSELYTYLLLNHAASTPQVYPQNDDSVIFRYDPTEAPPTGLARAPIVDVTFSGSILSRENPQLNIEFIATRPVRVAYQVVYQREGKWEFDRAQLIYDGAERFTAFGDQLGGVSAGRKVRTVNLSRPEGDHGYVLVQLVSIDEGRLTVHGGRVLSILPDAEPIHLTASVSGELVPGSGRELCVFVGHDSPCSLSVAIVDANDRVVHRICHRQATRPTQMEPAGSVFYWDGTLKDGSAAPPGVYRARVQAYGNESTVTVLSSTFEIPYTPET